jgi:hypothetical protein
MSVDETPRNITEEDLREKEYLDQVRRSVLQLVAAFSRYNPTSRFTLDIRIVERKDSVQKIA